MDRDIIGGQTTKITKDLLKKDIPIISISHDREEFIEQTGLKYSLPKHFTSQELIDVLNVIGYEKGIINA